MSVSGCKCGYGKHYPQRCKCWFIALAAVREHAGEGRCVTGPAAGDGQP